LYNRLCFESLSIYFLFLQIYISFHSFNSFADSVSLLDILLTFHGACFSFLPKFQSALLNPIQAVSVQLFLKWYWLVTKHHLDASPASSRVRRLSGLLDVIILMSWWIHKLWTSTWYFLQSPLWSRHLP
jgi:hypothetical protein